MPMSRGCVVFALVSAVSVGAYAQSAGESVLKLPDQMEWKAPAVSPGPSTAVLFGDPSKPGVYVTRTKFPAGLKVMPHTHPDEWRTIVVMSGTIYFALGNKWDESRAQTSSRWDFLFRGEGGSALRVGQGRRGR